MLTTEYLYGCQSTEFADLPYREALVYKLTKAKSLLYELVYTHYTIRDDFRIHDIGKAISFNEKLLKELN